MFGLGLIRFVPTPLRPLIVRTVDGVSDAVRDLRLRRERHLLGAYRRRRRQASETNPYDADDTPIVVAGLFASPTGIGQGARLMLHDFRRRGRQVIAVDVTRLLRLPGALDDETWLTVADLRKRPPATIVIHMNPPLYAEVILALPKTFRRAAWLVGYWAWELERAPESWRRCAELCDEIWVPSAMIAHALRGVLDPDTAPPITVVPHAVDALPLGPRTTCGERSEIRERHGLAGDCFVVGFSFAMGSNYARKNPMGVVAAFRSAFPARTFPDVRLLLRCNDLSAWPPGAAELEAAAREDGRIRLIGGRHGRIPIVDFYRLLDVFLSLHRSEGYGLALAEAASLGTSVIATDWWLPEDIAARPEVATVGSELVPVRDPQRAYVDPEARWAEPNIAEAAACLRAAYEGCRPERAG